MRIIILFLALFSLCFGASYKDFALQMGYETSYKIALEKAKSENKNLMVLMISNFCPWCSKLEKRVLAKEEVDKALRQKFVTLILNKEEKNFPQQYASPIVPTLYFVEAQNEKIYNTQVGYLNKSEMLKLISTSTPPQ